MQEQGIIVRRHEERDPAPAPDASYTDHLNGRVENMIPVEQHAAVVGKRLAIVLENRASRVAELGRLGLFRVVDQWRLLADADLAADRFGELRKIKL